MNKFGFARVAVCSPEVAIADPPANAAAIFDMLVDDESDVVVFPELCITGYTCADLFRQRELLDQAERAVSSIVSHSVGAKKIIFVGAPIPVGTELFNCAIAISNGKILGIVPKQNIPTYNEFYEHRWFAAADGNEPKSINYAGRTVPFGTDLLFQMENSELIIFAEICEDLWMPIPPSSYASIAGATLCVNLSASNETVAKSEYRTDLIRNQSGRCLNAYAYASAGPTESTSDLVFSGHCLIAENGNLLSQSTYVGDGKLDFGPRSTTADIDVQKITTDQRVQTTFGESARTNREFRRVIWEGTRGMNGLKRYVSGTPFVPSDPFKLAARCASIFDIQCAGLARRLKQMNYPDVNIGVSGGLDSTIALLVCHKTFVSLGLSPSKIKAKTMPGFGTTDQTRNIAMNLMRELGVNVEVVDIRPACMQMFRDLKHRPFDIPIDELANWRAPNGDIIEVQTVEGFTHALSLIPKEKRCDLVFENVQARVRTSILMNSGFVVGTGDLSELALGWCTFNGDHMSMYNVNCSVPKTLIQFLVRYVAENHYDEAGAIRDNLLECAGMTISPELLPHLNGKIDQSTEDVIGPYILHDFFLLNFVRYGFTPEKILFLADYAEFPTKDGRAFRDTYNEKKRKEVMGIFLRRFFPMQFKRNCVPDGPKVGSVSLSPRGDWRMPSDASPAIWLSNLEQQG